MPEDDKPSAAPCSTFASPSPDLSFRDQAIAGRLMRVFRGHERAGLRQTRCHPEVQQMLLLANAEGEAGWTDFDGREIVEPFKGSHAWIVPAGVPHWIRLGTTTELIALYSERAFFDEVTRGIPLIPELFPLEPCIQEDHSIADLIATFGDYQRGYRLAGPNDVDAAGGLLALRVLAAHLQPRCRENETHTGLSDAVLKHIFSYIRFHIGEKLTRTVLAREAGTSPWHFARLFKMSTGKTPARYIRELRLDIAKARLLAGGGSITDLAQELGFCDHNQLAYNFKNRFGITPSAFTGPGTIP